MREAIASPRRCWRVLVTVEFLSPKKYQVFLDSIGLSLSRLSAIESRGQAGNLLYAITEHRTIKKIRAASEILSGSKAGYVASAERCGLTV
jgi:hypothetical protein